MAELDDDVDDVDNSGGNNDACKRSATERRAEDEKHLMNKSERTCGEIRTSGQEGPQDVASGTILTAVGWETAKLSQAKPSSCSSLPPPTKQLFVQLPAVASHTARRPSHPLHPIPLHSTSGPPKDSRVFGPSR